MKKLILCFATALVVSATYAPTYAQQMSKEMQEKLAQEQCKTIIAEYPKKTAEIEKWKADPKKNVKPETWLKIAQSYEDVASSCPKADSSSSEKAYLAYKKAMEVEPNGGKKGKDIAAAFSGQRLYAALFNQGVSYYVAKNLNQAEKLFGLAGQVNVKDTMAVLYQGIVARENKKPEVVYSSLEKYMSLGGKDLSILGMLAQMYRNDKSYDKSIAILKKAIGIYPNAKEFKDELFNVYNLAGKSDEAMNGLLDQFKENPTNDVYASNIGIMYDNQGKKKEAEEFYRKSLALNANSFEANYNLGALIYNQAIEIKREADKITDLKEYNIRGKAILQKSCDKFKEARPFLAKASALKSDADATDSVKNLDSVVVQLCK